MATDDHIFEFSIYNKEVRDLVHIGESHRQLDDAWAEQRYIQIKAPNEKAALAEAQRRYQEQRGFVITSVTKFLD